MAATSRRPYLIRAIFDWAVDNGLTPHVVVAANVDGVEVPAQHVSDGKIILNISPRAVQGLVIDNESIRFTARFGGQPFHVNAPPRAVLAIYAKESGEGVVFGDVESPGEGTPAPEPPKPAGPAAKSRTGRSHLKVVK
jgi:stringent starvation protein B